MPNLEDVMSEVYQKEFAQFDAPPKVRFSLRHRSKMRKILSSENCARFDYKAARMPIRKRILIIALIIILAAAGITATAEIADSFAQKKYHDGIVLYLTNADNSPQTIESEYYITSLPYGYEFRETYAAGDDFYTVYVNRETNVIFGLCQSVKEDYITQFHTEESNMEKLDINGKNALYIDLGDTEGDHGYILWDNGDYVLTIFGDFNKDTLIELAKSTKMK